MESKPLESWSKLFPRKTLTTAVGNFQLDSELGVFDFQEISLYSINSRQEIATIEPDPGQSDKWVINLFEWDKPVEAVDTEVISRTMYEFDFFAATIGPIVSVSKRIEVDRFFNLASARNEVKRVLDKKDVRAFLVEEFRKSHKKSVSFFDKDHKKNEIATIDAHFFGDRMLDSGNINIINYNGDLVEISRDTYEIEGREVGRYTFYGVADQRSDPNGFQLKLKTLIPEIRDQGIASLNQMMGILEKNPAKVRAYTVYALQPDEKTIF